jgi:hypothetical protein
MPSLNPGDMAQTSDTGPPPHLRSGLRGRPLYDSAIGPRPLPVSGPQEQGIVPAPCTGARALHRQAMVARPPRGRRGGTACVDRLPAYCMQYTLLSAHTARLERAVAPIIEAAPGVSSGNRVSKPSPATPTSGRGWPGEVRRRVDDGGVAPRHPVRSSASRASYVYKEMGFCRSALDTGGFIGYICIHP